MRGVVELRGILTYTFAARYAMVFFMRPMLATSWPIPPDAYDPLNLHRSWWTGRSPLLQWLWPPPPHRLLRLRWLGSVGRCVVFMVLCCGPFPIVALFYSLQDKIPSPGGGDRRFLLVQGCNVKVPKEGNRLEHIERKVRAQPLPVGALKHGYL